MDILDIDFDDEAGADGAAKGAEGADGVLLPKREGIADVEGADLVELLSEKKDENIGVLATGASEPDADAKLAEGVGGGPNDIFGQSFLLIIVYTIFRFQARLPTNGDYYFCTHAPSSS